MNKPFIVAEISANHGGRLGHALNIVAAAAHAGADAVKFQLFDPAKMAPASMVIAEGPWAGRNACELYAEAQTPREWFPTLFDYARTQGVEAFSSVFDTDGLAFLESIGCPRYKISSFEITDIGLIKAVAATGKPIIISTGMATAEEIRSAVKALHATHSQPELVLLKCTSAYPAKIEDANLAAMAGLKNACGYPSDVGLSDHSLGSIVAITAAALGATMIEKHLTLKRSDGGPDAAFSMEPAEFGAMVKACREAAAAIGTVRYGHIEAERVHLQLKGRTLAAVSRETGS